MKKINICLTAAALLAAGMSSAFAAQAPSSTVLTISGTINGGTCIIGLPSGAVTIPDIQQSYYTGIVADGQIGADVSVGNISLTHCSATPVSMTVTAANLGSGKESQGTFKYANPLATTGKNPLYYTLGYKNGTAAISNFNLTGTPPVTFNASSDSQTIPVTLKTRKNGATIPDIGKYTGNFTATVTYTANYK